MMSKERAIMPHPDLVQCFKTIYSLRDDIVLWELQEQANSFRAVSLINWNIRNDIHM